MKVTLTHCIILWYKVVLHKYSLALCQILLIFFQHKTFFFTFFNTWRIIYMKFTKKYTAIL